MSNNNHMRKFSGKKTNLERSVPTGLYLNHRAAQLKRSIQQVMGDSTDILPEQAGIFDAKGNVLKIAPKHWPGIKTRWVLCDFVEPDPTGEPRHWFYPVNCEINGDSGFYFLDCSEKYPMILRDNQVMKIARWIKKGKGVVVALDEEEHPRVFPCAVPQTFRRQLKPIREYEEYTE